MRYAICFQLCMSTPSFEQDTMSVRDLIVKSDDLTKTHKKTQNDLLASMTKKCWCTVKVHLKPQNSTSYVCIQRQRLEKSSNKLWLTGSQACEKQLFFTTRNFEVISTKSNKSEISYQRWDMQTVYNSACLHRPLNRIQCQWEVW
jgi:hypothetical protein